MITFKKCMDTIYTWKRSPISEVCDLSEGRKLLVLANGPSAKKFWDNDKIKEYFKSYDLMCMNKAIYLEKDKIFKLCPKYFVILDPAFLTHRDSENDEESRYVDKLISNTKEVLENVYWKSYLITNIHEDINIVNDNIQIVRINKNIIYEQNVEIYRLYAKNLANPGIDTVLEGAIYFGITYGYKEIALYGTEFSLFKTITVDDNNRLNNEGKHFYEEQKEDKSARYVRKEVYGVNRSVVAYYLHRMAECFDTFYRLKWYADFAKVNIFNYSDESMIDAFERRSLPDEFNEE